MLCKFITGVDVTDAIDVGGADVLYNRFNASSWSPLFFDRSEICVVDTVVSDWRLSQCTELHCVVCQSG